MKLLPLSRVLLAPACAALLCAVATSARADITPGIMVQADIVLNNDAGTNPRSLASGLVSEDEPPAGPFLPSPGTDIVDDGYGAAILADYVPSTTGDHEYQILVRTGSRSGGRTGGYYLTPIVPAGSTLAGDEIINQATWTMGVGSDGFSVDDFGPNSKYVVTAADFYIAYPAGFVYQNFKANSFEVIDNPDGTFGFSATFDADLPPIPSGFNGDLASAPGISGFIAEIDVQAIPEPSTIAILALAVGGVACFRKRS